MQTFEDVFSAFGGAAKFAEATGVTASHAQTMKTRDSIPPAYWGDVVSAAARIGLEEITLEALADIAATKRQASARQEVGASA